MTRKTFYQIHFTGEGFRTLGIYRLFFKDALTRALKVRADYDAEVRDWYESGEGQSPQWERAGDQPWFDAEWDDPERPVNVGGLGHTFPTCIHGSSRWTDYDNICGGCEDGSTAIQDAIVEARTRFLTFVEEWEWAQAAPASIPHETRQALIIAACEKFPGYTNPRRHMLGINQEA